MYYVNLSALNPVFKDGLISTYNEQTHQLEVSLNAVIPDTTNFVTTNTEQTISGFKTFSNGLKWGMLGGAYTLQTIPVGWRYNFNDPQNPHQIDFSLPIEKSGTEYTLATTDDIPSLSNYALKSEVPTTATSTSTLTPTTTQLVFTYADNTTETITLMTAATVSTTTTLS